MPLRTASSTGLKVPAPPRSRGSSTCTSVPASKNGQVAPVGCRLLQGHSSASVAAGPRSERLASRASSSQALLSAVVRRVVRRSPPSTGRGGRRASAGRPRARELRLQHRRRRRPGPSRRARPGSTACSARCHSPRPRHIRSSCGAASAVRAGEAPRSVSHAVVRSSRSSAARRCGGSSKAMIASPVRAAPSHLDVDRGVDDVDRDGRPGGRVFGVEHLERGPGRASRSRPCSAAVPPAVAASAMAVSAALRPTRSRSRRRRSRR